MSGLMRLAVRGSIVGGLALATVTIGHAQENDPGRLYARVTTLNGSEFEGFLQWDVNEGHWADLLDATKRIPRRFRREAQRLARDRNARRSGIRVMGVRISWNGDGYPSQAQSGIRMGHIAKIEVLDDSHALLYLKSGQEQELLRSSTDLGDGNRGIIIKDRDGREIELDWDDVDVIEFEPAPRSESPFGRRLFGTLRTQHNDEFTGWITWDMDEIYESQELNGRTSGSRGNEDILFRDIEGIEQRGSSSARVTLRSGSTLVMSGTNDVNSQNRGILVGDPGFGQIKVDWDDFEEVRFHEPSSRVVSHDAFDGGHLLTGTVHTRDGQAVTGAIRWDNDELYSWEILDGDYQGMEVKMEFGLLRSIERVSDSRSRVTVLDGRSFVINGSNDVNEGNKGIFVTTDAGETVFVDWDDFRRVEFRN